MATPKSTMMSDSQDIQRRMAQVRRDLHQEAQQVVRGAQSMTDWKGLVRSHPWLSLGIAASVGYLIVPSRRIAAPTFVAMPAVAPLSPSQAGAAVQAQPKAKAQRSGWGMIGTVFGLVAPIAVRAAQNYAMNYVEQYLTAQTLMPPTAHQKKPDFRPGAQATNDSARRGSGSV